MVAAGLLLAVACRPCHAETYQSYQQTGMGRSVSAVAPASIAGGSFFNAASDRHYAILRRGGAWFVRRHQAGFERAIDNVVEKQVHYVIGSGNHARSYVHRSGQGRLLELPVSWYPAEKRWAMSPGYDRPSHPDFRREISAECLFCHAASPERIEPIDCQRCHGPGEAHARAPARANIVNPARLDARRQLEICLQCHLETTSRTLPHAIRRYDRPLFSYRPGERLEDYVLHFDHAAGRGYDDKFEINHAGYRLMKSRCFERSGASMTCTTCHDPHRVPRAAEAARRYNGACRTCHAAAIAGHASQPNCVSCHMPKRRAEDAMHMVMTDHFIQRRPVEPARRPFESESDYRGPVEPYYPPRPADRLYAAVAQVKDFSNLEAGIPMLEKAIAEAQPPQAEFYFDLAEAYWRTGRADRAMELYEEVIRRQPGFARAWHNLGEVLLRRGEAQRAIAVLENAPRDAEIWNTLGVAYGQTGRLQDSARLLSRAVEANPDLPSAWLNLGVAREQSGDAVAAEAAFRAAIRLQPDLVYAHQYLANLLRVIGRAEEAEYHARRAAHAGQR